MPDPPMDIRVDGGPQDGTLLVTWIPISRGSENDNKLAPVTGYAVFADGKRVTDVDSPSSIRNFVNKYLSPYILGDHALIDFGCIGHFSPKTITVRSKSGDVLSVDSTIISVHGVKQKKMKAVFCLIKKKNKHFLLGAQAANDAKDDLQGSFFSES